MRKLLVYFIILGMLFFPSNVSADGDPPQDDQVQGTEDTNIYNPTSEIYLIQGDESIKNIIQEINSLTEDADENVIRDVRLKYNAFSMAQKARVTNQDKLYQIEKARNITYDYASIYAKQDFSPTVSSGAVKGTSITYKLDDSTPSLSVSIQFITDDNVDGKRDIPRITIKKPDGSSVVIGTNTAELRDNAMNIKMTWTESFMQMDIASGEYGTWMILTDHTAIFTILEYAGSKQEIEAIPEPEKTETIKEEKKNTETIVRLGILVAVTAALIIIIKWDKKKRVPAKKNITDIDRVTNSEEDIERTKEELRRLINLDRYDDTKDKAKNDLSETKLQRSDVQEMTDQQIIYWNGEDDFLDEFK